MGLTGSKSKKRLRPPAEYGSHVTPHRQIILNDYSKDRHAGNTLHIGKGGGGSTGLREPLGTIISSWVLEELRQRLLVKADEERCCISTEREAEFVAGMIKYTSSVYVRK